MAKNFGIVGSDEYKGMTIEEATQAAEANGFSVRIVEKDGESFIVTMDLKQNRLNFRVRNGLILEAYPG